MSLWWAVARAVCENAVSKAPNKHTLYVGFELISLFDTMISLRTIRGGNFPFKKFAKRSAPQFEIVHSK
jgi:hypothetical protein